MMLSDWFRKGLEGIQQPLQKVEICRIYAGTPIKGYNLIESSPNDQVSPEVSSLLTVLIAKYWHLYFI
jgi:hypothetical protein